MQHDNNPKADCQANDASVRLHVDIVSVRDGSQTSPELWKISSMMVMLQK